MKEPATQTQRADHGGSLLFCLLLSLLLHLALAWMLDLLPRPAHRTEGGAPHAARHARVIRVRTQEKKEAPAPQPKPQEPDAEQPFVKTQADAPERRPEQADFVSNHDSVACGEDDAPQRSSEASLPTLAGQEREDEIITFNQERQDGPTEHEGKREETPELAPAAVADTPAPQPPQPVAQGSPDGSPQEAHPQGEGNAPLQPAAESTASQTPEPPAPGEGLRLDELHLDEALTLTAQETPPAPLGRPEGREDSPLTQAQSMQDARRPVHDPSLAAHIRQPGLRTYERRTRSTGRFIFGRRAALNVAATPRGRYEAEIYRRIARMWYAACDEHRGDIIPGSITISLRLTRSGGIDSMELIRRRGASILQQSFSFAAIRHAALPPMPEEVQQGIIGKLYEMILTFNFD